MYDPLLCCLVVNVTTDAGAAIRIALRDGVTIIVEIELTPFVTSNMAIVAIWRPVGCGLF